MQIYVHLKEGGGPDGLDALKNKPQLHSMVARSLCGTRPGKNYIIFTGPSITSLTLLKSFEKQRFAKWGPDWNEVPPALEECGDGAEGWVGSMAPRRLMRKPEAEGLLPVCPAWPQM